MSNSQDHQKALISLKNYHLFHYKDSCYFVSKFDLKYHQSVNECRKNRNSDLFYIKNEHEIDHYWKIEKEISLLLEKKISNKDHDGTPEEKHYHIGLKFNSRKKIWFWSNGLVFDQKFYNKIRNDRLETNHGFSAYLLFVTGNATTISVSQRSSSRKNFICRLSKRKLLN